MLGDILRDLTDPAAAEAALADLGDDGVIARIRDDAAAEGIPAGAFVARAVRHGLDHAGEEVWLDLLGRMAASPQPGVVALEALLRHAFAPPAPGRKSPRQSA